MTNKQVAVIVAAILVAGMLAVFGPSLLGSSQQSARDDSLDCSMYRLMASTDNLKALSGKMVDRAATERKRIAGGCTPVD
jgi:hypothetical protein